MEAEELLYHWYSEIVPVAVVAVTLSAFAVAFVLYDAVTVCCELITGIASTVAKIAVRDGGLHPLLVASA